MGKTITHGEEEEEYFIEKIISSRIRRGKKEYLVKWEGCPHWTNTWETSDELDCPELIHEYEQKANKKKTVAKKTQQNEALKRKAKNSNEAREKMKVTETNYSTADVKEKKEFVVEKIMASGISRDKNEYLVKWEGFPHSANTWETLIDCPDLIKQYEKATKKEDAMKTQENEDTTKRKADDGDGDEAGKKMKVIDKNYSTADVEEEDEHIVEKIIDSRIKGGKKEHLLNWKGYANSTNTLETSHELDCPELIKDYEQKAKKNKDDAKQTQKDEDATKRKNEDGTAEVEEEEEHVEKIINSRIMRGKKEYLVKWEGYPDSENTWETLIDCPELIKEYEKAKKNKDDAKQTQRDENATERKNDDGTADGKEKEEHVVEKIINSRKKGGKTEYFFKWEGYPDSENTWETSDKLDCSELIKAYENKAKKEKNDAKRKKKEAAKKMTNADANRGKKDDIDGGRKNRNVAQINKDRPRGFDRGLAPECIYAATESSGEMDFLMKWKGSKEADLVSAHEANINCPQIVIAYYENNIQWGRKEEKQYEIEINEDERSALGKNYITTNVEEKEKLMVKKRMDRQRRKEGYPESKNTSDILHCPELINAFEEKINKKEHAKKKSKVVKEKKNKSPGFDSGLDPDCSIGATEKDEELDRVFNSEYIIGITESGGELMFVIKWKDSFDIKEVPVKEAHILFPQIVIEYYEKNLKLETFDDEKGDSGMEKDVKTKKEHAKKTEYSNKKEEDANKKTEAAKKTDDSNKKEDDAQKKKEDAKKKGEDATTKEVDANEKEEDANKKEENAKKQEEEAKKEDCKTKEEDAKKEENKNKKDDANKKKEDSNNNTEAASTNTEATNNNTEAANTNAEAANKTEDSNKKEEDANKKEEDANKKEEDANKKEEAAKKTEDSNKKEEDANTETEDAKKTTVSNNKVEDARKKEDDAKKKEEDTKKKEEDAEKDANTNMKVANTEKETTKKKEGNGDRAKDKKVAKDKKDDTIGFDRGLDPDLIIGATDLTGERMYLMKWKDNICPNFVPTWQANLHCPHIVIAFYEKRFQWETPGDEKGIRESKYYIDCPEWMNACAEKDDEDTAKEINKVVNDENNQPQGFDRGLDPECIIAATSFQGANLKFLMKWKDTDEPEYVSSREANIRCPQIAIAFFENNIEWDEDEENGNVQDEGIPKRSD